MVHCISMTGITTLRQSAYKSRHNIIKEAYQEGTHGYCSRKDYKAKYPDEFKPKKKRKKKVQNEPKKEKPKPTIKKYTVDKKQVIHRIKNYLNAMKGEKMLYFWTVTFPVGTSDDAAYLLLNKWFTRLRSEKMLKDYLWIAERQTGERLTDKTKTPTNTIHFHIVINHKMDVKRANRYMRAAIMYSIDKREIDWTREQAKKYNGVDICKDKKTKRVVNFAKQKKEKSLSNYLTKYVTKNNESFQHLAWHGSRGYSNLITSIRLTAEEFHSSNLKYLISNDNALTTEYFTFYRWKGSPPESVVKYLANLNQSIQIILS